MPSQRKPVPQRIGRRRDEFADLTREFNDAAARVHSRLRDQQQRANEILHDLKSPLARLSVALGLARQQAGLDAQEALDRIERESEKINQMLQQLLALARAEAGMGFPATQVIDLLGLVRDVTEDANFEAARANRAVQLLPCGPCAIHAVKETLRSAIENVTRNAVVHTPEGTAVEISVTRPRAGKSPLAIVSVRDHGQGVPPSMLGRIFRPFFRLENPSHCDAGGSGLGLAIAERAVNLHGGTISAANHPDGGLIVEMRLPAKARLETSASFPSAAATGLN